VRTLWGALLTVPGYVLTDNKTKYGNYGQVDRARCIRCKTHIFHRYVPDLLLKMGGGVRLQIEATVLVRKGHRRCLLSVVLLVGDGDPRPDGVL
jgi:hypothetical protein